MTNMYGMVDTKGVTQLVFLSITHLQNLYNSDIDHAVKVAIMKTESYDTLVFLFFFLVLYNIA